MVLMETQAHLCKAKKEHINHQSVKTQNPKSGTQFADYRVGEWGRKGARATILVHRGDSGMTQSAYHALEPS
jgi:hypothetical protein